MSASAHHSPSGPTPLPIRLLGHILLSRWFIGAAQAAIAVILVIALGEIYLDMTSAGGLTKVLSKEVEEEITGVGVILIGWGVALEERQTLREIFGILPGRNEAIEQEIDHACHRAGLGLLIFGLFAEVAAECIRIPDRIINTAGIEDEVFTIGSVMLVFGLATIIWHLVALVRISLGQIGSGVGAATQPPHH